MHDFHIDFVNVRPDWTILVHDVTKRSKPVRVKDNVRVSDAAGNVCYGFISRKDVTTNVVWIVLDKSTYRSVRYA